MTNLKIIVHGPFASGKTTFIRAISERPVISVTIPINHKNDLVSMDYGFIAVDNDISIVLLGTHSARPFQLNWRVAEKFVIGYIIMVDSAYPGTFREAKSILEVFRAFSREPYVVVANKQDKDGAWPLDDLRLALDIPPEIPVVPCVATDKESVKRVLVALLNEVLKAMAVGKDV